MIPCTGYIPQNREGHGAAMVGETMYAFGGRAPDGTFLGDLVALDLSSEFEFHTSKLYFRISNSRAV